MSELLTSACSVPMLDAALRYAPRTIPLYQPGAFPAPDQRNGKAPSVGKGWPSWQATPDAIRAHWRRHPADNVGVRTGRGLVVIDVDPRAGGHDVLSDLEHEHGELPDTIEVATGGGGRHLYFSGPADLSSFDLALGLEIKAAGRQVVAPPSVHPDTGELYRWAPDLAPGMIDMAALPAWIAGTREAQTATKRSAAPDAVTGPRTESDDPLLEIAPIEYFKVLAGAVPDRRGFVRCPLPGHEDRTPSCRVYATAAEGWFCFGCRKGGTLYDLASLLIGGPHGTALKGAAFERVGYQLLAFYERGAVAA